MGRGAPARGHPPAHLPPPPSLAALGKNRPHVSAADIIQTFELDRVRFFSRHKWRARQQAEQMAYTPPSPSPPFRSVIHYYAIQSGCRIRIVDQLTMFHQVDGVFGDGPYPFAATRNCTSPLNPVSVSGRLCGRWTTSFYHSSTALQRQGFLSELTRGMGL